MSEHTPGVAFVTDGEELWAPCIVETDYALEMFEKATEEGSAGNLSTAVYPLSLVKAAPELLKAAKMAFQRILPGDPLNPDLDPEHVALRDAIAKAEGRKP